MENSGKFSLKLITTLRFALFSMLLFSFNEIIAQSKTDSTLREVKIHSKHKISNDTRLNDYSPGQKVKTIDSATLQQYQMQSMANLLSQQVPVFVKSYGFNGLATLNFRGSSAAQSAVFWNGIPVQNAALGIADVSELPVSLMNRVNIVYGGSAALWGSGNVGGALLLENDAPVFDTSKRKLSVKCCLRQFRAICRWYQRNDQRAAMVLFRQYFYTDCSALTY